MRRQRLLLTACALAATVMVAPASAQCPAGDGTLPGSSSSVTAVGTGDATPYTTIYVDDRDLADLDDDGNAQGIWIYIESNGERGLQRGRSHLVFDVADPDIPYVALPGWPNLPGPPFLPHPCCWPPAGVGGEPLSEVVNARDDCPSDANGDVWLGEPDAVLF